MNQRDVAEPSLFISCFATHRRRQLLVHVKVRQYAIKPLVDIAPNGVGVFCLAHEPVSAVPGGLPKSQVQAYSEYCTAQEHADHDQARFVDLASASSALVLPDLGRLRRLSSLHSCHGDSSVRHTGLKTVLPFRSESSEKLRVGQGMDGGCRCRGGLSTSRVAC